MVKYTQKKEEKKSVFRYAERREWLLLLITLVASFVSGANQPGQLIIFGQLLDSFNETSTRKAVRLVQFFALMYCVVALQQLITITTQAWASTKVAATVCRRLRRNYLQALLVQPVAWFDARSDSAAQAIDTTQRIQDGLGDKFAAGLQGIFAFFIGICVSLYYAWSLTLLTIGMLPVIILLLTTSSTISKKAAERSAEAKDKAASAALDALKKYQTIAVFNAQEITVKKYAKTVEAAAKATMSSALANGLNAGAVAVCLYSTWAIGLWYGAYLIRRDQQRSDSCTYRTDRDPNARCVTGGDVMVAFLCVLFGGLSLLQALPGITGFTQARTDAHRLLEVIDSAQLSHEVAQTSVHDENDLEEPVKKSMMTKRPVAIEFVAVDFAYPSRPDTKVFDGFTMRFEAGKTYGMCGASGSGKSTIVSLILRFYDVDAGTIYFDGGDIRDISPSELRRQISYVQQEPVLFSGTVASNIRDGWPDRKEPSQEQIQKAAQLANAHDFITQLPDGYETKIDSSKLSGGQKQRIAIARALIRDPNLLLLDEATSALDARSERVVHGALSALLSETSHRTTIIIAHRLSTIRTCDQVIVLGPSSGGSSRVLESGTHEELTESKGAYYELCKTQLAAEDEATVVKDEVNHTVAVSKKENDTREKHDLVAVKVEDRKEDVEASNKQDAVRWLWRKSRPERPALVLGLIGAAISGAVQPAVGYLMAEFVGVFFATSLGEMRRESRKWSLVFVALALAASLAELLKAYGLSRATERVAAVVNVEALRSALSMDAGWHDSKDAGEVSSRLLNDVNTLKGVLGPQSAQTIAMVFILVGGLAVSFEASWRLTLVTLAIIPLIVLPVALTAKYVARVSDAARGAADAASSLASASVSAIRTVRAFGLESRVNDRFDALLALPERQAEKNGLASGLGSGVSASVILLGAAFQYYIGSIFFRKGWVSFTELMTVLLVIIFLAFGLGGVAGDAVDKLQATRAADRVYQMCLLEPSITDERKEAESSSELSSYDIEFMNIKFAYPTRPDHLVFSGGFCLKLPAGATVACVGESGSGKSSLVQLLLRHYDLADGVIKIGGIDIRDISLRALRSMISVVSQEPVLFEGSVLHNICYGSPDTTHPQAEAAAKLANAHDFISKMPQGYDTALSQATTGVSGGQKQRICIARALIRNPKALLLDEATSALSAIDEAQVQAALDSLIAHSKLTSLVIAHRLNTVQNADTIVVLHQGTIVEQGTHQQLIQQQGAYYALSLNAQGYDVSLLGDSNVSVSA